MYIYIYIYVNISLRLRFCLRLCQLWFSSADVRCGIWGNGMCVCLSVHSEQ